VAASPADPRRAESSPFAVVRAAGGLVVRKGRTGNEVLLVHRPRYDDWTFPKGKLDADERDEDAALREVEEETGYRCSLGDELPSTQYLDARGRPKVVRYWLMHVDGGRFVPNREVDEISWLTADDAAARLTYAHDRELARHIDE
jgi:8-oxo-dGTP diphosphatase